MSEKSFFQLIKTRRSIRKFRTEPVEQEKTDLILEAALRSPASRGNNPWEFIVVRNARMLYNLSLAKLHGSEFLAGCPLAIVVIADMNKSDVWIEDASIASVIIQLQAHDAGLGSCWTQIRNRKSKDNRLSEVYVRELLNIPEHYAVLSIIAIGYPDETKKPHKKSDLEFNKIHSEIYDSLKK